MSKQSNITIGCRTIRMDDTVYMRLEDITYLIRQLGSLEEPDTNIRCYELADNIESMYGIPQDKVG